MLIGITGSKGSGKDEFARALGFTNVKMADPLKEMLRTLYKTVGYDLDEVERKIEGDLKETPCVVLQGKTPRYAMQTLGTEWRNMIGQYLWADIWAARVDQLRWKGRPIVCTDIRFTHEAAEIKKRGGFMVRVDRPELISTDAHVSEVEMQSLPVDFLITNDLSIAALHDKARALVKDLSKS